MAKKRKIKFEPKPPPPPIAFSPNAIAKRLQYVDVESLIHGLFDAIDEAKGMAGALPPDECDEAREGLDQLRKTVVFVFGADR